MDDNNKPVKEFATLDEYINDAYAALQRRREKTRLAQEAKDARIAQAKVAAAEIVRSAFVRHTPNAPAVLAAALEISPWLFDAEDAETVNGATLTLRVGAYRVEWGWGGAAGQHENWRKTKYQSGTFKVAGNGWQDWFQENEFWMAVAYAKEKNDEFQAHEAAEAARGEGGVDDE